MIKRIVVEKKAVSAMQREMRKVFLTETGGPMVGYVEDDEIFITDATGPGPRAELTPCSVLIDGIFAQKFCNEALQHSDGRIDYVGDWHCHPSFSVKPSTSDRNAMKIMAEFEYCPTKEPISLIWSRWRKRYAGFIYREGRLHPVAVRILHGVS